MIPTRPVEAPGATSVMQRTGQDASLFTTADIPEVQTPGPALRSHWPAW